MLRQDTLDFKEKFKWRLPGAEALAMTEAILAGDADINEGMEEPQRKAREVCC